MINRIYFATGACVGFAVGPVVAVITIGLFVIYGWGLL
jgi:hypothetical protein